MTTALDIAVIAVVSYLIGSIPAAYLVARRVRALDIREVGEGNPGARNVFHEVGPTWGLVTFVIDFGKGAVVAALFAGQPMWQVGLAGALALVGHAFPVWLGFVGGKGLATVGGFSVVLIPWAALLGALAAALAWAASRRFLPSVVSVIVVSIIAAPLLGYPISSVAVIVGLFVLVGMKRFVDEPRMKRIEAATGWNRIHGGTT